MAGVPDPIRIKLSDQVAPQSRSEKITTKDTKDTKEHEGHKGTRRKRI